MYKFMLDYPGVVATFAVVLFAAFFLLAMYGLDLVMGDEDDD